MMNAAETALLSRCAEELMRLIIESDADDSRKRSWLIAEDLRAVKVWPLRPGLRPLADSDGDDGC